MKNKNNENVAIIVGFGAILLVIIFTLLRGKIFPDSKKTNQISTNQASSESAKSDYTTIGAKDLNKKILGIKNNGEKITLLDIRPFDSYIEEHIVDAINITPDELEKNHDLDAHNLIVIIGASSFDGDIQKSFDLLKDAKITNVVVLAGGMISWKEQIGDTVTYGDPKSFVDQSKVSYTDAEKLNEAISQQVPVYIIDVRLPEEYANGHISGAINIPFEELEKRRKEISEKKVVVVGANELQEFQASVQMYDMLLVSPFVVRGAMPVWQEKGFATVK